MTCINCMLISFLPICCFVLSNAFFLEFNNHQKIFTFSSQLKRTPDCVINRHFAVPEIAEFTDDNIVDTKIASIDTHGYEGDFMPGDVVRVNVDLKLWHVKGHTDEGLNCNGFVGTVQSLELYGRKLKTLCSAITPIKVRFEAAGEGVPEVQEGALQRFFFGHFSYDELELISRPPPKE